MKLISSFEQLEPLKQGGVGCGTFSVYPTVHAWHINNNLEFEERNPSEDYWELMEELNRDDPNDTATHAFHSYRYYAQRGLLPTSDWRILKDIDDVEEQLRRNDLPIQILFHTYGQFTQDYEYRESEKLNNGLHWCCIVGHDDDFFYIKDSRGKNEHVFDWRNDTFLEKKDGCFVMSKDIAFNYQYVEQICTIILEDTSSTDWNRFSEHKKNNVIGIARGVITSDTMTKEEATSYMKYAKDDTVVSEQYNLYLMGK